VTKYIEAEMAIYSFVLVFAFLFHYFCKDSTNFREIIPKAHTDLTGIDYYELKGGRDFKRAVEYKELN